MTIFAVAAAGAAFGAAVYLAARAIRPRPVPLAQALADLERPRHTGPPPTAETQVTHRLGQAAVRVLETTGLVDMGRLSGRLRTLGKPVETHAYEKLVGALAGFTIPIIFALTVGAAGVTVSPAVAAVAAVGLALAGFMYPDLGIADKIERRRRDFRHSLSAYLDLVTVILAGGGGLETALQASADMGDGWAFAEIRAALRKARLTNRTPWEVFDDLGAELGVDELRELAAAAQLAGDQGARIRASLAAKADSMRAAQTAAIEAQAEAATEKMLLPVVTLVVGMILFIGFGVVQAISTPGTIP